LMHKARRRTPPSPQLLDDSLLSPRMHGAASSQGDWPRRSQAAACDGAALKTTHLWMREFPGRTELSDFSPLATPGLAPGDLRRAHTLGWALG
jgi:hypothetical protein